jgi:hypothetical protein
MTQAPRALHRVLWALAALGLGARIVAWWLRPELHPDELFQYVDPAVHRLRGVGWQTWEWHDGVRSWVLTGYHGAWMVVAGWLGITPGMPTFSFLQLHWAVVSTAWVLIGWAGGDAVGRVLLARAPGDDRPAWEAAVLGAAACAIYPPLVVYGARTLSEVPSGLCLVASLVLVARILGEPGTPLGHVAFWAGLFGAAGVCLRLANGPLVLVPLVWLLTRRRWRCAALFGLGGLVPLVLFGAVDWATWGRPFGSFLAYARVNLVEGRAAEFGVEGPFWYVTRLWDRAGLGATVLIAVACAGWRATWPFLASAIGLVAYLSTQAHKEERFVMCFWPFLLVAACGVAGAWLGRQTQPGIRRAPWIASALVVTLLAVDGLRGVRRLSWNDHGTLLREAQALVARQTDVTGLLVDEFYDAGAYAAFGRDVPLLRYRPECLPNPIFNYLIAGHEGVVEEAERSGFTAIRRVRDVVVLQRR